MAQPRGRAAPSSASSGRVLRSAGPGRRTIGPRRPRPAGRRPRRFRPGPGRRGERLREVVADRGAKEVLLPLGQARPDRRRPGAGAGSRRRRSTRGRSWAAREARRARRRRAKSAASSASGPRAAAGRKDAETLGALPGERTATRKRTRRRAAASAEDRPRDRVARSSAAGSEAGGRLGRVGLASILSVIGTLPMRSSSPSRRATGEVSRMPLTKVPFFEPRSSSVARPEAIMTRACRRETLCASIQTRESVPRPRMFSPSARAISRWPQSSRNTWSLLEAERPSRWSATARAAERVAVAVDRPDELRRAGAVADRLADLGDQRRQVHVGDHRVGPEPPVQLGLRDARGLRLEEDLEKLKRLRRDRDRPAVAGQRPALGVENVRFRIERSWRSNENTIPPGESSIGTRDPAIRTSARAAGPAQAASGSSRRTRGESDSAPRSVHDDVVLDAHAEAARQVDSRARR